jgi:protocatechuate 3,4-dioxygenase beta subunit
LGRYFEKNNAKNMKRFEFIQKMGFSVLTFSTALACAKSSDVNPTTENTNGTTNGSSANDCTVTSSETAGPYPTKNPTAFKLLDIRADRKGTMMTTRIFIKNKNTGCGALANALVDIWHCDADGNYSQYGSTASGNFLRGRQTTDANGLASFTTIFPGWYNGRAPHIHVQVFDASGRSLLITQIAFPKTVCDTVYTEATNFYTKGKQDTTNEGDGIFRDGYATELAGIAGNITDGFTLTHNIVVNA